MGYSMRPIPHNINTSIIEHGLYARTVKGKILLMPFNNSSEYKFYTAPIGQTLMWWKSENDNNLRESLGCKLN